jgi:hypothetical protein
MSQNMAKGERLARINDLTELIKYEREHMLAAVIEDPGSIEASLVSISLMAMERELAELERGAAIEATGRD